MRLTLLALLPLLGQAQAQAVRDAASGLALTPPEGYEATARPARPPYTAIFGVRRAADTDTGCQVAFAPAPQNAGLTQDELNRAAESEGWRASARRAIGTLYDIRHEEGFGQDGISGLLLEGEIRPRDSLPPRALEIRTLFTLVETPRGRTSTVCVGERADFAERRMAFIAVARGAEPPR